MDASTASVGSCSSGVGSSEGGNSCAGAGAAAASATTWCDFVSASTSAASVPRYSWITFGSFASSRPVPV
ncbi:MAG: hypothetical protein J0I66_05455 [Microbacterium sp.]|nr:hypothetical protein [Microbacterium sp.]